MTLSTCGEAAVAFARKGLGVIPIASNKRPAKKFAGLPNMTPDECAEWWERHPSHGLALKTEAFFVVDIDVHNGAPGVESFKSIGHPEWFEDTLVARTASGGWHYFFMKPEGNVIRQNIGAMPGIDIKAHDNNYVVVAPTTTDKGAYRWMNHKPIKEPSKELVNYLVSLQPSYTRESFGCPNERTRSKTTELFEMIANGFGDEGGRNNALASFVGGLLIRGVNPDNVAKLAFIANQNSAEPLNEREVMLTVDSMIAKDARG